MEVASGVGSFGRRLTIINPTSADVGMYVCEASLLDSSVKPAEAKAFLSITGKTPRPIKAAYILLVTVLSQPYVHGVLMVPLFIRSSDRYSTTLLCIKPEITHCIS